MAIAIDPVNCGCTECLTRQYVPLNRASEQEIIAMLNDEIGDNTGYTKKELIDAIKKYNHWVYDEVADFLVMW